MRKGGGTEVPGQQCTHTAISAPRIILQKISICPPNVMGIELSQGTSPEHLSSESNELYSKDHWQEEADSGSFDSHSVIPVRKEHCSFEVVPHTTNR